jgi:hypothetical protein
MGQVGRFIFDGELVSMASFANAVHKHDVSEAILIGARIKIEPKGSRKSGPKAMPLRQVYVEWKIVDPGRIEAVAIELWAESDLSSKLDGFDSSDPIRLEFQRIGLENEFGLVHWSGLQTLRSLTRSGEFGLDSSDDEMSGFYESSHDIDWGQLLETQSYQLEGLMPQAKDRFRSPSSENEALVESTPLEAESRRQVRFLNRLLWVSHSYFVRRAALVEFVGPLREIDQRLVFEEGSLDAKDQDTRTKAQEEKANKAISHWLKKLTGGRYEFELLEFTADPVSFFGRMRTAVVVDTVTNTKVTFQDVGVGLSQVMPVLRKLQQAMTGSALRPSTILIEQPELHLHPKMQADLVDLFVEVCTARPATQFVLETHSESLLLRVQKLLRTGALSTDQVQVLFVGSSEEGNEVIPLELKEENDFELDLPVSFSRLRLSEYI